MPLLQEIARANAAMQEAADHKSFKKGAALAELLQAHADVAACYAALPAAHKTAALQALHRLYTQWTSAGKPFDAEAALQAMRGADGRCGGVVARVTCRCCRSFSNMALVSCLLPITPYHAPVDATMWMVLTVPPYLFTMPFFFHSGDKEEREGGEAAAAPSAPKPRTVDRNSTKCSGCMRVRWGVGHHLVVDHAT